MDNIKELQNLAIKVDKILKEELDRFGIPYNLAEARIYDVKTVGVQGDNRTYAYLAEITLFQDGKLVWNTEFISTLSNHITNDIKEINRVVYMIATK